MNAALTLALISVGGLVTSKGVGMSVPDWPTSYGYNMFLFPPSQWVGGIFHEHVHRLLASGVGLVTLALAVALQWRSTDRVVRRIGWCSFGLVVFQGVLGGLRVVLDHYAVSGTTLGTLFGLAHACTGQSFFVLMACISLRLSRSWDGLAFVPNVHSGRRLRWMLPVATGLVFSQLFLGAAMRHQHAGLAIHDFPLAYGQWWPATDAESIFRYNQVRPDESLVTAFQIILQMVHRLGAVATLLAVATCGWLGWRSLGSVMWLRNASVLWIFVLVIQASLGIATVMYDKPADVATGHVAIGAISLAWGMLLTLSTRRVLRPAAVRPSESTVWQVSMNPV